MIDGFKKFLLRGNVIDLAVAVVVGVAFNELVKSVVDGFINPLIAAIFGETDLTGVGRFEINEAVFSFGLILDSLLDFVLIAAAIYFLIVLPINKLNERRQRGREPEPEAVPEDVALLREIRDLLTRDRG
jgi:large conductance mechanosensitive channel